MTTTIKLHCLEFWRLTGLLQRAPEKDRKARAFFLDEHIANCPACQAFLFAPQAWGGELSDEAMDAEVEHD